MVPRCVLVERPTEYEDLLARHATREQVRFFLERRDRSLDEVEERHRSFGAARALVLGAVPAQWRTAVVARADLDRFLFEPEDVVTVLGQDGLVANVAKYVDEQPVLGLNPDPERVAGVLVRHPPAAAADLLRDAAAGRVRTPGRTMVEARLDDGQAVLALNEVFLGHASHQSARYTLSVDGRGERQSSSGVIVATGTGDDGLGREHQRRAGRAARAAGARRAHAGVLRPRGVAEPDDRDPDHRGHPHRRAPARHHRRARGGGRGLRRRDRGRPRRDPVGSARGGASRRAPAASGGVRPRRGATAGAPAPSCASPIGGTRAAPRRD